MGEGIHPAHLDAMTDKAIRYSEYLKRNGLDGLPAVLDGAEPSVAEGIWTLVGCFAGEQRTALSPETKRMIGKLCAIRFTPPSAGAMAHAFDGLTP